MSSAKCLRTPFYSTPPNGCFCKYLRICRISCVRKPQEFHAVQKIKFFFKDFYCKFERRNLWKKSLIENFIFLSSVIINDLNNEKVLPTNH